MVKGYRELAKETEKVGSGNHDGEQGHAATAHGASLLLTQPDPLSSGNTGQWKQASGIQIQYPGLTSSFPQASVSSIVKLRIKVSILHREVGETWSRIHGHWVELKTKTKFRKHVVLFYKKQLLLFITDSPFFLKMTTKLVLGTRIQ